MHLRIQGTTSKTMTSGNGTITQRVRQLFGERGGSLYGGEAVTQLEHALQAAWLAEQEQAPAALVAAALLHDVGHLLHHLADDTPDQGIDDEHEELAACWLQRHFPTEVVAPIQLHVAAKRYLCSVESNYLAGLSPPSLTSLELQGGPMSADECLDFEAHPHFEAAIRLRRWDDAAKVENLETPPLEHFLEGVAACELVSSTENR